MSKRRRDRRKLICAMDSGLDNEKYTSLAGNDPYLSWNASRTEEEGSAAADEPAKVGLFGENVANDGAPKEKPKVAISSPVRCQRDLFLLLSTLFFISGDLSVFAKGK